MLLGATLPLTLMVWAGPVAILQASIVSVVTFGVIYWAGVRLDLDRRLAATLGLAARYAEFRQRSPSPRRSGPSASMHRSP